MSEFIIRNIPVFSADPNIQKVMPIIMTAPKFVNYMDRLDLASLKVSHVEIFKAIWFCAPSAIAPEKLGFLFMEVKGKNKETGKDIPGIVFLRGGAVAVYIIVEFACVEYVVLTEQFRTPCGKKILELPAGMMDASSNFAGVAMKELAEETGLSPPNISDLVYLGAPIIPSGGGCDEEIQLFFWRTTTTPDNFKKMQTAIYGSEEENETIRLRFIPLNQYERELLENVRDAKAHSAHLMASIMGLVKKPMVPTQQRCPEYGATGCYFA